MVRRVFFLLIGALALTGCRLDVDVAVEIEPDGTGVVTVHAVADDELVSAVPGLVEDLRFDDAIAAGWTVDGPTPADGGGTEITLTHPVESTAELANVLASIGPPFTEMAAGRTTQDDITTNAIDGTLALPDGFQSFADADLLAAVGGLPWAEQITASGATPESSMSFTLRVELPGELESTTGREVESDVFEWEAPLDGSSLAITTVTVQRPPEGGSWARPLATVAFVLLVVWVVVSIAFITYVVRARRRKAARRRARV